MFPPSANGGAAALDRPPTFGAAPAIGNTQRVGLFTSEQYLDLFKKLKKEYFADWWIYEKQWTKILHYLNNRQWLAPYSRTEGWRDARLARNIPRPVTNKAAEADQAIRAMFTAIKFGVLVRPTSQDQKSISTATNVDNMMPLLHDLHNMDEVMNEGDFWLVNTGNVILHSYWDYDAMSGAVSVRYLECTNCHLVNREDVIAQTKQRCPSCQKTDFVPALDQYGEPRVDRLQQGGGVTTPLSLLECRFPMTHPRWSEVPGLIRQRWRDKSYYEENPALKPYVKDIQWQRTAGERSMQIFQSLPFMNDQPTTRFAGTAQTGSGESEGVAEFELWLRPTPAHPEGVVLRVAGDGDKPVIIVNEEEGLPGELPYHDTKGNPLFPFTHARYKHVGGRVVGSGAHDAVMGKYDALNRLDSFTEMITMRMAAPQWKVPKGAEVEWLGDSPGLPGLILQWNSQIAGAAGRPEREPGIPPDPTLIRLRELLLADIEEGLGTYDILRGAKPAGVEAFSALQLLVERGQARFANSFMSRGKAYRDWAGFAVELEREFGPTERIMAVMSPTNNWTFNTFKRADLRGDVMIIIEDGTYTPKTSLGERAAIEHGRQIGIIDVTNDIDQKITIFRKLGLTELIPGINAHMQAALKKQEDFERYIAAGEYKKAPAGTDPAAILVAPNYPLKWRRWFDANIHRQEFLKWANSSRIQAMLATVPEAAGLLESHLLEIDLAIQEAQAGGLDPGGVADAPQPGAPGEQPPAGGAGMAMANSNQNSGGLHTMPGGPAMQGAQAPM